MRLSVVGCGAMVHEYGLVLVGERHGTNEIPRLVLRLATAAARLGRVSVALELGDDARDPTTAFARSAGSAADRERLLASPSWQQQDGRASQAMLSLVDGLRVQISAGAGIEVDVFDAAPVGDRHAASYAIEHERMLAERLLSIRRRGAALALSGNVHVELVPRADAVDGFVPAAAQLADEVSVVSLPGRHSGGESWSILPIYGELVAGAHRADGRDQGREQFIEVDPPSPVRSGITYVRSVTPSRPAVERTPPV